MHAAGRRCPDRPAASYQTTGGNLGNYPWPPALEINETFMPPEAKSVTPTVFYPPLSWRGWKSSIAKPVPEMLPTVLLLHGFPSCSHMFRNLIPMLADKYHVVAPDFPGYGGKGSVPSVDDFDYSFERLAL